MDYAQKRWMNAWLRHPVLGDPSFDSFERVGECVHRSEKPYEWAVNGSLFRDPKDGGWYYYAGLYPYGYKLIEEFSAHCIVYKSADEGVNWECLGPVFEKGFAFDHHDVASDIVPDAVVTYDEQSDTYWMAYDWCTNNSDWSNAFNPLGTGADSGAALAWAKTPAGPFTRLPAPHISNVELAGDMGRFKRIYASTLLKRKNDWITLALCDSSEYFSWGLACMTAPSPEGPWSRPVIVMSVDRPEYYPAPVEFYPCFAVGDTVYAPATSVAASRNYQAVFSASLEEAHEPEAWSLLFDGNAWHSRPRLDEKYGIWGQTFHGFVHNGIFNVMYPSKNEDDHGTLFVASRPWEQPFSDGFTLSAHKGKAISPVLAGYVHFSLKADVVLEGTVDFAFDYGGILGPNESKSDAVPHQQSISSYSALRLSDEGSFKLITVDFNGVEFVHAAGSYDKPVTSIELRREGSNVIAFLGGIQVAEAEIAVSAAKPLALIAHEWSNLNCSKFEVTGHAGRYELFYNGFDALLGAGQRIGDWEVTASELYRSNKGLVGQGRCKAKWNVIGDGFDIYAPTAPEFGTIKVYVDGELSGHANLYAPEARASAVVHTVGGLTQGRHSVQIEAESGKFVLDIIAVHGSAEMD
ncbi:hypothetical protein [Paenibacillus eucommiae]|uniref:Uncharacterized protein n=1 Tax=Paenibacillus eucommiae TaxID=1355755 RepID=A0ABS4J7C2_9BACL|nr:hypothetical protein [Paenibacillus eucommiae]MBP1995752.1 hypothetical protein [Paenibacillus eucommiae]